jgi:dihydroorotase
VRKKNQGFVAYTNIRIIDPESGVDFYGSLLIEDDRVVDFGVDLFRNNIPEYVSHTFDFHGCNALMIPGVVDVHVHFREPGQEHKETIYTGSCAAVAGGVTTVVCQPNTFPPLDDLDTFAYVTQKAEDALNNILFYGAISKGLLGKDITDMSDLRYHYESIVGFTDDGKPVMNSYLMHKAFKKCAELDVVVAQHAEDITLNEPGASINHGKVSDILSVPGIYNISESIIVGRDLALLTLTPTTRYHVLHVSATESINLIRDAKLKGFNVTSEVTPNHLLLTDDIILKYDTLGKINPPLRSENDRQALLSALKDDVIDIIASDHAPHTKNCKNTHITKACFGIIGVETLLPLSLELYHNNMISLLDVLKKLTNKPADLIKRYDIGRIKKGAKADLVIVDLNRPWCIDEHNLHGKSHNTPFLGYEVKSRVIKTIIDGAVVYEL